MCDDLWRWQSMNPQGFNTKPSAAMQNTKSVAAISSTEILRSAEMED
jgi:hypothetical protein